MNIEQSILNEQIQTCCIMQGRGRYGTCLIHEEIEVAMEMVQDDRLPSHQLIGQITSLEPSIYKSYNIYSYAIPVTEFISHYN